MRRLACCMPRRHTSLPRYCRQSALALCLDLRKTLGSSSDVARAQCCWRTGTARLWRCLLRVAGTCMSHNLRCQRIAGPWRCTLHSRTCRGLLTCWRMTFVAPSWQMTTCSRHSHLCPWGHCCPSHQKPAREAAQAASTTRAPSWGRPRCHVSVARCHASCSHVLQDDQAFMQVQTTTQCLSACRPTVLQHKVPTGWRTCGGLPSLAPHCQRRAQLRAVTLRHPVTLLVPVASRLGQRVAMLSTPRAAREKGLVILSTPRTCPEQRPSRHPRGGQVPAATMAATMPAAALPTPWSGARCLRCLARSPSASRTRMVPHACVSAPPSSVACLKTERLRMSVQWGTQVQHTSPTGWQRNTTRSLSQAAELVLPCIPTAACHHQAHAQPRSCQERTAPAMIFTMAVRPAWQQRCCLSVCSSED
mmetsp:Transcript_22651/g.67436  ORF Transcript_22651/g.67436 Transcript_22651/m.67436 type:complete len:419 (-) Transcript_22651:1123-2379(-)